MDRCHTLYMSDNFGPWPELLQHSRLTTFSRYPGPEPQFVRHFGLLL